ncbi:hypothetical protein TWF694_008808 [Orbilia ellipsospora]|uniref:Uncharacterized protein n=1 Tax=Orbilia ellipsospora TaxID=2528407 RepID=A0AAV9XDT3_9PEZI
MSSSYSVMNLTPKDVEGGDKQPWSVNFDTPGFFDWFPPVEAPALTPTCRRQLRARRSSRVVSLDSTAKASSTSPTSTTNMKGSNASTNIANTSRRTTSKPLRMEDIFKTPAPRSWAGNEENESPLLANYTDATPTPALAAAVNTAAAIDPILLHIDDPSALERWPKQRSKPFSERISERSPKRQRGSEEPCTPLASLPAPTALPLKSALKATSPPASYTPFPSKKVSFTGSSHKRSASDPQGSNSGPEERPKPLTEAEELILADPRFEEMPNSVAELKILLAKAQDELVGERRARIEAERTVEFLQGENEYLQTLKARPVALPAPTPTTATAPTTATSTTKATPKSASAANPRHPPSSGSSTRPQTSLGTRARPTPAAMRPQSSLAPRREPTASSSASTTRANAPVGRQRLARGQTPTTNSLTGPPARRR